MIEIVASKMATSIKNVVPDHPASHAVLKFALSVILNVVSIIGLTLMISVITRKTMEAVIILISFALLRQVTGGKHLKSGTACVLFTTALFTLLSYVDVSATFVLLMNVISLIIVMWLAPIGIERQTRIPKRHWPKLKVIAAALVITNVFVGSSAIAVSFLSQVISLILAWKEVKSK